MSVCTYHYTVLYTKQLTRKKKTYQDGILKCYGDGRASLFTEDGQQLGNCRLPNSLRITEDTENITCFDGFLVNIDALCVNYEANGSSQSSLNLTADLRNSSHQVTTASVAPIPVDLRGSQRCTNFKSPFAAPENIPVAPKGSLEESEGCRPSCHNTSSSHATRVRTCRMRHVQGKSCVEGTSNASGTNGSSTTTNSASDRPEVDVMQLLFGDVPLPSALQPDTRPPHETPLAKPSPAYLPLKCPGPPIRHALCIKQPNLQPSSDSPKHARGHLPTRPPTGTPTNTAGAQMQTVGARRKTALAAAFLQACELLGEEDEIILDDDNVDVGPCGQAPASVPATVSSVVVVVGSEGPERENTDQSIRESTDKPPICSTAHSCALAGVAWSGALAARREKEGGAASSSGDPAGLVRRKGFNAPKQTGFQPPSMPLSQQPIPSTHTAQPTLCRLSFPGPTKAPPQRLVQMPAQFKSLPHYLSLLVGAMEEEVVLKVAEAAKGFYHATAGLARMPSLGGGLPAVGSAGPNTRKGVAFLPAGPAAKGPALMVGASMADRIQQACKAAHVLYFGSCQLTRREDSVMRSYYGSGNRATSDGGKSHSEAEPAHAKHFLQIERNCCGKVAFGKHDVWVLSSHHSLDPTFSVKGREWVALCQSLWHGPDRDGNFQVEFLTAPPASLQKRQAVFALKGPEASTELNILSCLRSFLACCQLPNSTGPLLPHLCTVTPPSKPEGAANLKLDPKLKFKPDAKLDSKLDPTVDPGLESKIDFALGQTSPVSSCVAPNCQVFSKAGLDQVWEEAVQSHSARFKLNSDQEQVLWHVAHWLAYPTPSSLEGDARRQGFASGGLARRPGAAAVGLRPDGAQGVNGAGALLLQPPSPVCLVHGPFGSGKSTLLVALITFLLEHSNRAASKDLKAARVLVCSHTNVAVDRVLQALLDDGCTDLLRVGSLQRISPPLLKYSLHSADGNRDAVQQLKDMVNCSRDPVEIKILQSEIGALQAGAGRQRCSRMQSVRVVGVTGCGCLQATLDGQQFDLVVLDECCQMIEPLSLVPLLKYRAKFLVAAGDPCQLPPVITAPAQVAGKKPGADAEQLHLAGDQPDADGLMRPLFVRLMHMGHARYLLRKQYRCHPALSSTPNSAYYQGKLLDGCTAQERSPLVQNLPPLCFCDPGGSQETDFSTRSSVNKQEAAAVVKLTRSLLEAGLQPHQLGIICIYRAQVSLISDKLVAECAEVSESAASVRVATVDSFQGAEKDVILLATTATRSAQFCSDANRLNVALTRARHHLVIFGSAPLLRVNTPVFRHILQTCQGSHQGFFSSGQLPRVRPLGVQRAAPCIRGTRQDSSAGQVGATGVEMVPSGVEAVGRGISTGQVGTTGLQFAAPCIPGIGWGSSAGPGGATACAAQQMQAQEFGSQECDHRSRPGQGVATGEASQQLRRMGMMPGPQVTSQGSQTGQATTILVGPGQPSQLLGMGPPIIQCRSSAGQEGAPWHASQQLQQQGMGLGPRPQATGQGKHTVQATSSLAGPGQPDQLLDPGPPISGGINIEQASMHSSTAGCGWGSNTGRAGTSLEAGRAPQAVNMTCAVVAGGAAGIPADADAAGVAADAGAAACEDVAGAGNHDAQGGFVATDGGAAAGTGDAPGGVPVTGGAAAAAGNCDAQGGVAVTDSAAAFVIATSCADANNHKHAGQQPPFTPQFTMEPEGAMDQKLAHGPTIATAKEEDFDVPTFTLRRRPQKRLKADK